jgi:hypothetical protein
MTGRLPGNIKYLVFSLLLLTIFIGSLSGQVKISGVVNDYAHVTGLGTDYVIIDDEAQFDQFAEGDTVLLIQMKGIRIYVPEDGNYGLQENSLGPPGAHEFLTILSIDDGTNKITFRNNISTPNFNLQGLLQLIKVPSFNYAIVDTPGLTCQPWDSLSKTGGVLAAIVGRTLSLSANIDVSARGFKGGTTVLGTGICIATNEPVLNKYAYDKDYANSGYKGESPVIRAWIDAGNIPPIYPGFAKGRGGNFSGGGAGNGRFSGGGGGGSYGAGGKGGIEKPDCGDAKDGGVGGRQIKLTPFAGGLFLGSGGGSSTYLAGAMPSAGGNGGGIVILVCDTIMGNGKKILAEGESVTVTATGDAGAGGGGGGGSIALYLQSYSSNPLSRALTISAKGGKGGDNAPLVPTGFGEGGGGGGGLIKTSSVVTPAEVVKTISGGLRGQRFGTETSGNGQDGESLTNFVPILNGFLFNSIRSSVTGNQVDSICSNVIPKPLTGTFPVGGSGSYTYLWQKSYNLSGAAINIPASNVKDYTPAVTESDTVWFRRIVKDDVTFLTDTSKWVEIRVQTAIAGNLVGEDTTICYGQDPLSVVPLNAGPTKGNGFYTYQWIQNPNNTDWSSATGASGTSTGPAYDPPALNSTTFYKRVVTSGRCIDQSSAVSVTVLPLITGNITSRPDSVICEGSLFNTLGASAAGGGQTGTYWYQWQDSTASGTWQASSGTNINTTYIPDTTDFSVIENRYFRRVVWSGPDSVCRDNSLPILLTRYHYIENNSISKDTTICSGSIPPELTGTTPTAGSGSYTYIWQDSTNLASWTDRGTALSPFAPPALTDTTWYRRIVNSSKCSDTSMIVVIKVHKPLLGNNISLLSGPGPDTTICSGATPNKLLGTVPTGGTEIPGDYAYQWFYSTDNFSSTNTAVAAAGTLKDYQPGTLPTTTWFRRKAISGKCETFSSAIKVTVLPPITNNAISAGQVVCYGTVPAALTGPAPNGGDPGLITYLWEQSTDGGSTWVPAAGSSNQKDYTAPALTIPTEYRRTIRSGLNDCCISVSGIVSIGIHALPTGSIDWTADTTLCNGATVKLKVTLSGASSWTLTYNENSTPVTVSGIAGNSRIISRVPDGSGSSVSVFNYTLTSLIDGNNCSATPALLTGTRKATVYRVPVANAGPDDEVCGPGYKLNAVPSDGTGLWSWKASVPVLAPLPTAHNSMIYIDSSFTEASKTYKFYWEETSWLCASKDSVELTFYNRIDPITITEDTTIYSFDYRLQATVSPLKAFETGSWSVLEGSGNFNPPDLNVTDITEVSEGKNKYRWTVTNGECLSSADMEVTVVDIVIPEGFSPNRDTHNDSFIIKGLDLRKNPDGSPAYQLAELSILNSAGTQVFATSNLPGEEWKEWDGTNLSGSELPEGTYYYLLRITALGNGQVYKKSGFIILKRY